MHQPHTLPDKALLALEREMRRLQTAKYAKVPLDPPIRRGWKRCYFLTHAASQRADADVLTTILEKINVTHKHWRRDFTPTKRNRRNQTHHLDQQLKMLENHHFGTKRSQLPAEWRGYFMPAPVFEGKTMTWKLAFREPQLFELRIVPNLQTEAQQIDPPAVSREAEIDQQINFLGWNRLTRLHGRRCWEKDRLSPKEREATRHGKNRIRAAYAGDVEAEKITLSILGDLVRLAHFTL